MKTQIKAVYGPVSQTWMVVFGKVGAPIEQWSIIDVCGRRSWFGKRRGRFLLVEDLARIGLRLLPGPANIIITEEEK